MAINQKVTGTAREVLGQFLRSSREERKQSMYSIEQASGLTFRQVEAIETGSKSYTIDSLLAYLQASDMYVFFADRGGNHLNQNDMIQKGIDLDPENSTI